MKLQLHNSWQYQGEDKWKWSAYLVGPDLEQVANVEYILHPSFKRPLRKVDDPTSGFIMTTSGWGTFQMKAIVHMNDGTQQLLTHQVKLEYKPESGRTNLDPILPSEEKPPERAGGRGA